MRRVVALPRVTLKIALFSGSFRVDRQTRKDLKTDKFAEDVFDVFGWASAHKAEVVRYGAALDCAGADRGRRDVLQPLAGHRPRGSAVQGAARGGCHNGFDVEPTSLHFDTEAEKTKAKMQAFTELSAKYSGTQEGAIADMYLASYAVDSGNQDEAERRYKRVVDDGPKPYASLARIALSQIYVSEGKSGGRRESTARRHRQSLGDGVQGTGSTGAGRIACQSNPAEAHKLLDPLRTSARGAISRTAIMDSSKIANGFRRPSAGQVTTGAAWIMTRHA